MKASIAALRLEWDDLRNRLAIRLERRQRDRFAAAALQALLSSKDWGDAIEWEATKKAVGADVVYAEKALLFANAMMFKRSSEEW